MKEKPQKAGIENIDKYIKLKSLPYRVVGTKNAVLHWLTRN